MSRSSLLADVLTRIRNGQQARHSFVVSNYSNFIKSCLDVLKKEGYIKEYEQFTEGNSIAMLKIDLKYYKGSPVINKLKMISTPGCRVYKSINNLPKSHNGLGTYVLSTSKGILTDHFARVENVGGEVLFEIF